MEDQKHETPVDQYVDQLNLYNLGPLPEWIVVTGYIFLPGPGPHLGTKVVNRFGFGRIG